ncbi:hypothetical protein MtrunA17_Chr3g0127391 [Medicago truncatula]|uniref:Uncharacterized protein n=1 Tax=Medicago truncatula TaxID=3880 RepID=A0A396IYD3_MEDTR|nr:hypothetical protein MtrunA17_Chr3g0127391 [Medicago truncatula]
MIPSMKFNTLDMFTPVDFPANKRSRSSIKIIDFGVVCIRSVFQSEPSIIFETSMS